MLAIVIPYYNIDFFEATLRSLKEQTDQRFVVYIGNDGSAHNPKTIIDNYFSDVAIVYKDFKNNIGSKSLVTHWERCLNLLKNEKWIQILGDDDVLSSNFVAQFYIDKEEIEALNINVVRAATQLINGKGLPISEIYTHPTLEKSVDAYLKVFNSESRSSLSEYIFSKKAYLKHGFKRFPLAWHSDDLAWLEFSEFGEIYTLSNCLVSIRLSEVNISGKSTDFKKKNEASFQFYSYLLAERISRFSLVVKKEFLLKTQFYLFKTKQFRFKNWGLIVLHLLKMFEFLGAFRFTKKYLKKKYE